MYAGGRLIGWSALVDWLTVCGVLLSRIVVGVGGGVPAARLCAVDWWALVCGSVMLGGVPLSRTGCRVVVPVVGGGAWSASVPASMGRGRVWVGGRLVGRPRSGGRW